MSNSFSEQFQTFYYFNLRTQQSQWIHPHDAIFKKKVQETRARTLLGDTSEEIDSGIRSGQDMDGGDAPRFVGKLAPLTSTTTTPPLSRVGQIRRQFDVQKVSEEEQESRKPPIKGGFTLTGTGSMFLKSNAKKPPPSSSSQQTPEEKSMGSEKVSSGVKGILRDSSLTDVRTRMSVANDEEDKKSVRFSLSAVDNDSPSPVAAGNRENNLPQRPSSALNKNLVLKSNSDDSSTDDEGEEVIEELENDEDEDAWTPRPKPGMEIKVVTSAKVVNSSTTAGSERQQQPEMKNQLVDLHGQEMKRQLLEEEVAETGRLEEEIRRVKRENEQKMQRFLAEEEKALQEKRDELEINKQRSLTAFESELEAKLKNVRYEIEESYRVSFESFKDDLNQEYEEKRKAMVEAQKVALEAMERKHQESVQVLDREHANQIAQIKSQLNQEIDSERQKARESGDDRLYEKMRCEKRLLEDKYRCLKDKYVRLKTDVKLSLEKRNSRRREQQQVNTASDSNSPKTIDAGASSERQQPHRVVAQRSLLEKKNSSGDQFGAKQMSQSYHQQMDETTTSISEATTVSHTFNNRMNFSAPLGDENSDSEAFFQRINEPEKNRSRDRVKLFSRMKSASTSRLHSAKKNAELQQQPCTPVENLRRQLQKLEDLEDQFPENTLEATYHLRYPFNADSGMNYGNTSSELEFFKHRLHLERDSIRRAKDNLKNQRENFRARRELRSHTATGRHKNVEQVMCEEKELTEMEVNLHRTRALLGEKVIRLRHLEQSLARLYEKESKKTFSVDNKNDATLSDLSSHSSSGFSSTDFMMSDTNHNRKLAGGGSATESTTDILKNLEMLNSEIKEIWELLSKQQTTASSGTFYSSDLDWSFNANSPNLPLTPNPMVGSVGLNRNFTSLVSQQPPPQVTGQYTSTLVERTRDLRNWLRQAKQEHLLAQKNSNI